MASLIGRCLSNLTCTCKRIVFVAEAYSNNLYKSEVTRLLYCLCCQSEMIHNTGEVRRGGGGGGCKIQTELIKEFYVSEEQCKC